MSSQRHRPDRSNDHQSPRALLLEVPAVAALIAGAIWVISTLTPDDVRQRRDPGFLDNVFASPIVIAAARVVLLSAAVMLLFAGLYIVTSIVVRMRRGHWLRRAEPFESELVEETRAGLERADAVAKELADALERADTLERMIEDRDADIDALTMGRATFPENPR